MPNLTIRNIDSAILEGLRTRASASGKTVEEEAQRTLAIALNLDGAERRRRLQQAYAMADELARTTGTIKKGSSLRALRELREGRHRRIAKK